MEKRKLLDFIETGAAMLVRSTHFSLDDLRKMAKAAKRNNTQLTIVVGNELTCDDCRSIADEAQNQVRFDFRETKITISR